MKIYTFVSTHYNNSDVGVILLGDHNQIYLQKGFKITNTEESEGHIDGIKRALSFVKNMKPLYAKEDAQCIFECDERAWTQTYLDKDPYTRMVRKALNINVEVSDNVESKDKYYLNIARNSARFKYEVPHRINDYIK
jgi:hypothetical protein